MGIEQSWHYLCILLVWKLAGQDELVVAVEDAERLVAAFPSPEAPPYLRISAEPDGIHFQVLDSKTAELMMATPQGNA